MQLHSRFVIIGLLCLCAACGRFGPPVPPEQVAPSQVGTLKVSGSADGLAFHWEAPKSDQRGKDLKQIDGYRIYRKPIEKAADISNADIPFEIVTTVADTHLVALQKAQEEARKAGRPAHRAKIDSSLTTFDYVDKGLKPGMSYLYKVIPFNQGGVEGDSYQLVKVLWRGESTEVSSVDKSSLDVEEGFNSDL